MRRSWWVIAFVIAACAEENPVRHLDGGMGDSPVADAPFISVAATASTGGSVATKDVTGGSCTDTSCLLANGASTVTFMPVAELNFRFDAWTGATCTGFAETGDEITYTNPTSDHACNAEFVATVSINAIAATGGSVTVTVTGGTCTGTSCTLDVGASTVTFSPTASANHQFSGWSGCSGYTQTGDAITFTNPASAKTCTASFGATVAISATAGTGGTVAASNVTGGSCSGTTCTLDSGAGGVTFTATPNANYRFGSWSGCTGYTANGASITFTNSTVSKDCTASFVATVSVSATAGTGGSLMTSGVSGGSCSGSNCTLDAGASSVTFTPVATSGYRFGSWSGATCTGYAQTGDAITFANPASARACTANFIVTVSVSATAATGGSVAASNVSGGTCSGTSCTLDRGASSVTFKAIPSNGYRFTNWSDCSPSSIADITITNPTSTTTCTANFAATVVISASANTGGLIMYLGHAGGSCSGNTCTLDSGASSVAFAAVAGSGYRFSSWSGATCSGYAQSGNTISFTNPTASHACTASFVASVNVDASAGTGGTVGASNVSGGSCSGTNCTLDSGAGSVTFTATPSSGYRFDTWLGCSPSTSASIAITNATNDTSCTAMFVRVVYVNGIPMPAAGGMVAVSNNSNASCSDAICTLDYANSTVQFTPIANSGFRFAGWSGQDCAGYFQGSNSSIIFSNPTFDAECYAVFVETVNLVAVAQAPDGSPSFAGTVSASNVSGGSCSGTDCTLDAGASSVTFTPVPGPNGQFFGWTGCTGYSQGPGGSIIFTDPTTSQTCTAVFNF